MEREETVMVQKFLSDGCSSSIASSPGVPWAGKNAWYTLFVHAHNLKAITR